MSELKIITKLIKLFLIELYGRKKVRLPDWYPESYFTCLIFTFTDYAMETS
jgi:hypothetical protein